MFCCLTLSPKTLTVVCQVAGLGSLEKEGSTETSSKTSRVRWNSKEPGKWSRARYSPWGEPWSLTSLVNAAVLVSNQIPSSPAAEGAQLSPSSLHCHRWAGARNEKADFCLELADTYHFASKWMKIWMLFPHAFWLAQLIFFLACNSASSWETTKTAPKPPKTNSTTAELCFCQGDSGSPPYEKQLLAPKVCPRNPSYILFLGFVTWPDASGVVVLTHFYIK